LLLATPSGSNSYSFTQREITLQLHPYLPPTPLWAYDDGSGLDGQAGSFGMAVVAQSATPLTVSFTHGLPATYPDWIPVDTRLTPFGNQVRLMTHLHGGFVAGSSDGNPAATPDGFGPGQTQTVFYTNQLPQMPASLLWFHDHGLGATRLNVFAGLAAAYIVRDQYDTRAEPNPIGIPGGAYEIPLVIQDRSFNRDGTFLYPASDIEGATWIGEYFGDTMLVNGKVWPFLRVEPRMYRLRILNGCNARILGLDIGGVRFWQIGAEGGMWDRPVELDKLILAPAERADVLVDFSGVAGQTLLLRNNNPRPPVSTPAPALPTIMQIRVGTTVSQPGPTAAPASLPGRAANLLNPVATRYITLNEIDVDEPTWFLNLDGVHFDEGPVTETPRSARSRTGSTSTSPPTHIRCTLISSPSRSSAGPRSTLPPTKRPTRGRTASQAGSTRRRLPRARCSRPHPTSEASKIRSGRTLASSRRSEPSSSCPRASTHRRGTSTTVTSLSTRTTT
jgi:spore coat protein A